VGAAEAQPLPQVSFLDPNFGLADQGSENDERPPTERGQAFVSKALTASRSGPYWRIRLSLLYNTSRGASTTMLNRLPRLNVGYKIRSPAGSVRRLSDSPLSRRPGLGAKSMLNPFTANDSSLIEAGVDVGYAGGRSDRTVPPW
jgi:hypothetical protein